MKSPTLLPVLVALLSLASSPPARATGPMLVLHLTDGPEAAYAVGDLELVRFDADTLVLVMPTGSDRYPASTIRKIDFNMDLSGVTDPRDAAALVKAVHLFQSQPNPFSAETRIAFDVPQSGKVELGIFSPDGRLVRALVSGERPSGRQEVRWDGLDDSGHRVAGGVYFYSLRAAGVADSRRMILLP